MSVAQSQLGACLQQVQVLTIGKGAIAFLSGGLLENAEVRQCLYGLVHPTRVDFPAGARSFEMTQFRSVTLFMGDKQRSRVGPARSEYAAETNPPGCGS